jgi:hypothetical protein
MIEAGTDQNFAHFCNLVYARDDLESVPDFRDRVRASVAELGGGVLAWGAPEALEWVDGEPEVIDIAGGLKDDATGDFATVGYTLIERADGETVDDFRARARGAAVAAGRDHVVFGGLRPMNFNDEQPKGE